MAFRAAGSRTLPDLDLAIPMRSEEGRRLQPTGLLEMSNSIGVTLDALHTHRLEEEAVVHVRHAVESAPAGPPGPSLNVTNERDLVRLLLGMSIVAYGEDGSYPQEVLQPIIDARESRYGKGVTTYAQEVAKEAANLQKWLDAFKGTYKPVTGGTGIDASSVESVGVHALEFTVEGVGKVLAFRGSHSSGDFDNVKLWTTNWVLRKMSAKMKYNWLVEAGLPWSPAMKKQGGRVPIWLLQQLLRAGAKAAVKSFVKKMVKLAGRTKGLVGSVKASETGYWEFSKRIAEEVRRSLKPGEKLIMTGHSAGGTRAALLSMFLENKYGEKHRVVSLAALGGQCFSRDFYFTRAALADDVDIYKHHDQITDYANPLDIFASIDYGFGRRCKYGMTGVPFEMAKKYCGQIFGLRGPELILAGKVLGIGSGMAAAFSRCRYFTHSWRAIDSVLGQDTYLNADGTTDGGCNAVGVIPRNDPGLKCMSLRDAEGCTDELSCKSCQASSSGPCYWNDKNKRCISSGSRQSKSSYIGPTDVCPEAAA